MASDKVKVALRVRPFSRRELDLGTLSVVRMVDNQTILQASQDDKNESHRKNKVFFFDVCFDSSDPSSSSFADQETVFNSLGSGILDNVFMGYNACIFAYGQTGSGKSYTMLGSHENPGIIPRLCDSLFFGISKRSSPGLSFKVEVSYMEIYNEKVHDLLDPSGGRSSLKVREHNLLGPYVDGLSVLAVSSFEDIENLIVEGNKSRTVAATNMNSESSRSHAVFTVLVTQTLTDLQSGVTGEKVSRISLVDLAGSERAVKTGAVGERLKEGSNINKSLTTLGLVISKLADSSQGKGKAKDNFIPYRDSVLTWLLKDNLGGNSKTVMVATISPSADNYAETLSTLRYADRAKRIVNHAVVNEDPNAKIIRELRKEVEELREQLMRLKNSGDTEISCDTDLREKLDENEKIMQQMSQPWEEKLQKTERYQLERHQALEKMGISVQTVGISVQKNKFYLVNLNADPAMNEMLVYYLKEKTVVGLPDSCVPTDIQLCGLGIQPVHCILQVLGNSLFMEPNTNARCCLNGNMVLERVLLRHGDRLLWGNNHFFRVNCPRESIPDEENDLSSPSVLTASGNIDYDFARDELIAKELSDNPLQTAIERLEQQHQNDKQLVIERQQREYERQFRQLRPSFSTSNLDCSSSSLDLYRQSGGGSQLRLDQWNEEKEEIFRRNLSHLKQELMHANEMVREANSMAVELNRAVSFSVTLQIPPCNLSPNCRRGMFACEPAVLVRRPDLTNRVWSMDKMENKLIDMREMFNELQVVHDRDTEQPYDPFVDFDENHHLIGVANVFMEVLLHDARLTYDVPIISQQGEVVGRLQVDLERVAGSFQDRLADSLSNHSCDSGRSEDDLLNDTVTCRVTVKQASALPASSCDFIFCQYNFWGCSDTQVCPPIVNHNYGANGDQAAGYKKRGCGTAAVVRFHHCRDFVIPVCEEFIEHCSDGALSIEVWGHRSSLMSAGSGGTSAVSATHRIVDSQRAQARSLADRWSELTRKLSLHVQIHELNDHGEYQPVDVVCRCGNNGEMTGEPAVYQLRQGQQRRVEVSVHVEPQSGTLPLMCDTVTSLAIGSVVSCDSNNKPLDSYQEHDLAQLRHLWSEALARRRRYLDHHLQTIMRKPVKSGEDNEREKSLLDQWVLLNEERNAVLLPAPGSGIPGAPLAASCRSSPGVEPHIPVLFLNLNADDLTVAHQADEDDGALSDRRIPAGDACLLPYENVDEMVPLALVLICDDEPHVSATAQWDSSVHDSICLNRITATNERVYLVLRVGVRLLQPFPMDIVIRKRLCVNVYKPTFTNKLIKSIYLRKCELLQSTAVLYDVVSNVPKASEQLEERESLAQMAASVGDTCEIDGCTYIEKYLHGVGAVESLLRMDRLRQSVRVKEQLQMQARAVNMRKTASVPNISFVARPESSTAHRSESHFELSCSVRAVDAADSISSPNSSISSPVSSTVFNGTGLTLGHSNRPFSARMSTLHEDHGLEEMSGHSDVVIRRDSRQSVTSGGKSTTVSSGRNSSCQRLRFSKTFDSLAELPDRENAMGSTCDRNAAACSGLSGSAASSGYGSQTVSSSNLLSSLDLLPDTDANGGPETNCSKYLGNMPVDTSDRYADSQDSHEFYDHRKSEFAEYSSTDFDQASPTVDGNCLDVSKSAPAASKADVSERQHHEVSVPQCVDGTEVASDTDPDGYEVDEAVNDHQQEIRDEPSENRSCENAVACSTSCSDDDAVADTSGLNISSAHIESGDSEPVSTPSVDTTENCSMHQHPLPSWATPGEPVLVRPQSLSGIIRHVGPVEFASGGDWVGVELDMPQGKNDGSVQSVVYFKCRPRHGVFVRAEKLIWDHRRKRSAGGRNQVTSSRSRCDLPSMRRS